MEEFELSDNLDGNKVFIVRRSELDGRLDPSFNLNLKTPVFTNKFPLVKLYKLHTSESGGTPSKNVSEYWNGNIPWASPKDIKERYLTDTIDYISELGLKNSSSKLIEKNNLLIVFRALKENEINCSIIQRDIAINQDLKALYFNDTLLAEYVMYLFKTFEIKIFPLITKLGTTVYSINTVEFNKLEIPVPPIEVQREIIEIYNNAYSQKQQKEGEAKALLDSIDDYLLGELGITLPNEEELAKEPTVNYGNSDGFELDKENLLVKKGRLFLTGFREVVGQRIDPKLYDIKTTSLKQSIRNIDFKQFRIEPLKSFVTQSISGDWGIENTEEETVGYKKCLVIRATEFDNEYNLKLDNSRAKYRQIKINKLNKIDIKENDLLIEKSGGSPDQPVGRIAIITKDILKDNAICYSNFIHKIRVDNGRLLPEYLFCYLKTIHKIKLTESMQSQTNGIRNLAMSSYFNQDIVIPILSNGLPDLDRQNEIAQKIQSIRVEAMLLQQKAHSILNTVKQQVEQMILGN